MAQDNRAATLPNPAPSQKKSTYYGWYVLLTAMFIAGVTTGARNGFGVFVIPMSEELDFTRTGISIAGGAGWLVNGITQPLIGQIFDRSNSRWVILASILVAGLATAALSLTFNLYFLVFMFSFVLSTAMSGASIGTLMPLLARWFVRRRTLALGMVASGSSIGGMVLITLSGYLVDLFSWQISWIALGGIVTLLGLPIAFMFLRNNPGEMGLQPDGDSVPSGGMASRSQARRQGLFEVEQWHKSFRSPPIWNLSAAFTVCGITVGLLSFHFVPYASGELGIDAKLASLIFAILTGLNVFGAIGGGWLADRYGRKNVLGTVYSVRCLAFLTLVGGLLAVQNGITLPIIGSPGLASLWIFAVLAGFSWIASVPITASLTAEVYGLRALATISGISFVCHQVGAFFSIILGGVLYDMTGSYLLPFSIATATLVPAAIASFTINEKKYSVRYQTAPVVGAAAGD